MESDEVYNKYIILDAKTQKPKDGTYFCLRLDANEKHENEAVYMALWTYAMYHRANGREKFADTVEEMANKFRMKKEK